MAVQFPISSNVVEHDGIVRVKTLNDGDLVSCWWCHEPFIADENTAITVDKYGNVALRCPVCWKKVSVLYYYDQARPATQKDKRKIRRRARKRLEKML